MTALPPLQDPSKQIRLLKPRHTKPGEALSFDISVWDLDKAPPYKSISYTWGDPGEPSEVPKLLREEAEQIELIERLKKYLDRARVTHKYHYEFGLWLDVIEPRRNVAHMELYAMFGRPLRPSCIVQGEDPDPERTGRGRTMLFSFDFSRVQSQVSKQQNELQTVRSRIKDAQALCCRTVSIADVDRPVRRNCAYVLAQATGRSPSSYLWIDNLCIDQANSAEKGSQVAMMFDIYRRANRVLAGIGPAADQSDTIIAIIEALYGMVRHLSNRPQHCGLALDSRRVLYGILSHLGDMGLAQFSAARRALSLRPYWSRLWIVQEIFAATRGANRVHIMCGAATLSKSAIDWTLGLKEPKSDQSVHRRIIRNRDPKYPVHWGSESITYRDTAFTSRFAMRDILGADCSALTGVWDLFKLYKSLQCYDPRDLIYGLLSLVDWVAMDVEPMRPDYSKSVVDLALEVRARSRFDDIASKTMMARLGIDSTTVEARELVQQQHDAATTSSKPRQESEAHQQYRYPLYARSENKALIECVVLAAGANGRLEVPCAREMPIKAKKRSSTLDHASSGLHPFQDLYWRGSRFGVLCPGACEGDILIPGWYDECTVIVLRPSTTVSGDCDVIGQGLLSSNLGLLGREVQPWAGLECTKSGRECNRFAAEIKVKFSVGDVLALEAQDFEDGRDQWRNDDLRCERLVLCPVAQRVGSVSLKYVRCLRADLKWRK